MTCKKLILIFLTAFYFSDIAVAQTMIVQNDVDSFEKHIDSLLAGAYQGRLPIYDATGNEISIQPFYQRFIFEDVQWLMGDVGISYKELNINKPVYPNILRYGVSPSAYLDMNFSPEGLPVIDDKTIDKEYYYFDNITIDESTGQLTGRTFLFKIRKNGKLINRGVERLREIAEYYINNPNSITISKQIQTNGSNSYRNKQILYKGDSIPPDVCQQQYYLSLQKNNRFEQRFVNSEQVEKHRRTLLSGIDLFVLYSLQGLSEENYDDYSCCTCFIETDEGLWQVQNNELVLYTNSGIEMIRYKILKTDGTTLELEVGDVKVTLEKK